MSESLPWWIISGTAIGSSILTAIISHQVYRHRKRVDSRREYLNYLLKKRIESYEHISAVVAKLNITTIIPDKGIALDVFLSHSDDERKATRFYNLLVEFYNIWDKSLWVDNKLLDQCRKVYVALQAEYMLIKDKFGTEECIEVGCRSYPFLDVALRGIQIQLIEDLRDLNNIESHLAAKSKGYHDNLKRAYERLNTGVASQS